MLAGETASNTDQRTITAASVLLSVPAHMGILNPGLLIYNNYYVFRLLPQVWRLVTTFLLTGPQLGMILDPYFVFTYASQLETTASRFSQPGDFFIYLVFVCAVILVSRPLYCCPAIILSIVPPFPLHKKTSYICPVSPHIAVTVPENEGDYPCTVRHPSFA